MDKSQRSKRKRFRKRARIVMTLALLLCAGAFGSVLAQIGLSHAKSAGDFSGGGTAYSGGQGSGTAYSHRDGNPGMAHHVAVQRHETRRDGEDQGGGGGSRPHAGGVFGGMPGTTGGGRGAGGSGGGQSGFGSGPGAFGAFSGMGGGGGGTGGSPDGAQAGKSHENDPPQDGAADGCKDGCQSARNSDVAQDATGEETPKQGDPGIDLPASFDAPADIALPAGSDLPECADDYCAFTPPDETTPHRGLPDTDPGCTQNCGPDLPGGQPQPGLTSPQAVPEPASLLLLAPALLALRRGRRAACRGNLSASPH